MPKRILVRGILRVSAQVSLKVRWVWVRILLDSAAPTVSETWYTGPYTVYFSRGPGTSRTSFRHPMPSPTRPLVATTDRTPKEPKTAGLAAALFFFNYRVPNEPQTRANW